MGTDTAITGDATANAATKKCKRCGENKPRTGFSKSARKSDGLDIYCKDCQRQAYYQSLTEIEDTEPEISFQVVSPSGQVITETVIAGTALVKVRELNTKHRLNFAPQERRYQIRRVRSANKAVRA